MNIVQIAGRLGRDPESRFTPSGQKVTTFTVATNVRKGGKEETVWWRVTIWGERFDKLMSYLKKGSAVIVIGEMNKPEIWTDKEGRPQISLDLTAEIVRFSPFGNPERSQDQATGQGTQGQTTYGQSQGQGQSSYGYDSGFGDYGMGQMSNSSHSSTPGQANSHYAQGLPAEDPLPF